MRWFLSIGLAVLLTGSYVARAGDGEKPNPAQVVLAAMERHTKATAEVSRFRLRVRLAIEESDFDAWLKADADLQAALVAASSAAEDLAMKEGELAWASPSFWIKSEVGRKAREFGSTSFSYRALLVGRYERCRVIAKIAREKTLLMSTKWDKAESLADLKLDEHYMGALVEEKEK